MIVDDDLFQELLDRVAALEHEVAQIKERSMPKETPKDPPRTFDPIPERVIKVIAQPEPVQSRHMVSIKYTPGPEEAEKAERTLSIPVTQVRTPHAKVRAKRKGHA
jgi:hypothetical protein